MVAHNTTTGSNNNWAQADISSNEDSTGIIVRATKTLNGGTGYAAYPYFNRTAILLRAFNGSIFTDIGSWSIGSTLTASTLYTLKVSVTGNVFTAWLNGTSLGNITDTANTYTIGSYVGLFLNNGVGYDPTADNFSGGAN